MGCCPSLYYKNSQTFIDAAAVFQAYEEQGRTVFVADSFQGIPDPNVTVGPWH
jgi:hypothetical protein